MELRINRVRINRSRPVVGLIGKNQFKIKDNHGYITKVHRREIKKIPMTEKVCKLYEEEQIGKTREGRKVVPNSKMPNLAWDIAETQLTQEAQKRKQLKHNTTLTNTSHGNHPDNSHCETDNNTN